jgi:signal transduction histidine kinase
VTLASNLQEGLAHLARECFDAMIVDLGLPDSEGLETFDALHRACPSVPAVVMTGNDDEATAMEAVRRGAQDYIVKGYASEHTILRSLRYAMERMRLEEQLLQSQKMQAVGALADGIAHEFNNLLQVIMGYTRYVLGTLSPEQQPFKDLEQVMFAAERASRLTQQLLEFGRPHDLYKTEVQLDALVGQLADMLRPLLGDEIEFQVELVDDARQVVADGNQLQQALMNLCINARDAMPEGGRLRISSRRETIHAGGGERKRNVTPGQYVVLEVADTGCGIPAEIQPRVFEPFFTTKPPDKGTGLGLAVVYGIAKQHGGTVLLDSQPGHGTRFHIYLPAAEKRQATDTVLGGELPAVASVLAEC